MGADDKVISRGLDFFGDIAFRAKYWVLQSALDRIVLGEEGKNSFFSYFHILLTTLVQRGNAMFRNWFAGHQIE